MSANAVNSYYGSTASAVKNDKTENTSSKSEKKVESSLGKSGFNDTAAVYEKSSATTKEGVTQKKDNAAIIAQMKADTEKRTQQLTDLVHQMISQQGKTLGKADSIWSFLAGGDFTVSPEVKAQAQADIAEDGYWGVNQTSDRILDFAKALSGDDPSKADELLSAFKKGFEQATKSWGKDLPSISQDTYKAVEEKFNKWKNEAETKTEE